MKNAFFLKHPSEECVTEIAIQQNLLDEAHFFEKIKKLSSSFVLITDSIIEKLHAKEVKAKFAKQNMDFSLIVIPEGEKHKTRETKAFIEDKLLELKKGRDTLIIALGGGVVSDIAGFVASTYCRGVPYITLPTTLLSMVDASIGGKTAVNAGPYKNMIGTFYPPKMIGMDTTFLSSLPEKQWTNGMAEIIKYGLIASPQIIELLTQKFSEWQSKNFSFFNELIFQSGKIKCRIVEEDPNEKGLRRILNFGHTIGHAIESLENYAIGHGDAIAKGMCMESYISMKLGHLSSDDLKKIVSLLQKYGFSLKLSPYISLDKLKSLMSLDKKSTSQTARFVVLEAIGRTASFNGDYCTAISDDVLKDAFDWMSTFD